MYIFLSILGGLLLLLLIPLRLALDFEEELSVRFRYLFFSFRLYPPREKKRPKPEKITKKKKSAGKEKEEEASLSSFGKMLKEDGPGAVISFLSEMTKMAAASAKKLLRTLVIDRLELFIQASGEDAADTALLFGKICAGVYPALSALQCVIRTRQRQVEIAPDFAGGGTRVRFHIRLHAIPLRILAVGVGFIVRFLVHTIKKAGNNEKQSGRYEDGSSGTESAGRIHG